MKTKKNKKNRTSIISRSSRYQIGIAIVLVGIIPTFIVVLFTFSNIGDYSTNLQLFIVLITIILASLGISILYKYPKNLMKLRNYLESMAEGNLPDNIDFDHCEDDIIEIEKFLNAIVEDMREKIKLLEAKLTIEHALKAQMAKQSEDNLKAEQSKVMLASIGAVCHHIGQPTTILNTYLYALMKEKELPPKIRIQIEECSKAGNQIADILHNIQKLNEYKTVIYRKKLDDEKSSKDDNILDIG